MDFLGIGPGELLLIFVILLLVLGPKDMVKAANTAGEFIRKVLSSDTWRVLQKASREIRTMPNRLAREAGIQDFEKQMRAAQNENRLEGEFQPQLNSGDNDNQIMPPDYSAWTDRPLHDPLDAGDPEASAETESETDAGE